MWAELVLIVAAVAAFGVWQWRDLARERRRSVEAKARQRAEDDRAAATAAAAADTALRKGSDPDSVR